MPNEPNTDYTEALADQICHRISEGETLLAICREEGMPAKSTVFDWLERHETFRNHYARAHELLRESFAEKIFLRVSEGESLTDICSEEGMPSKATVYRWLEKHEAFRNQYARAKERMVESFAEEIIAIADDSSQDTISLPNGGQRPNWEGIARAKFRVKTRQWLMAKLMPRKYGDRAAVEHSGPVAMPMTLEEFRKRALEAER